MFFCLGKLFPLSISENEGVVASNVVIIVIIVVFIVNADPMYSMMVGDGSRFFKRLIVSF